MRNNGLLIDDLHSRFLVLSRDSKYGFESFRTDWGRYGSSQYGIMQAQFSRSLREFAKDCPVKWYTGSYYIFNGKIYERICPDAVETAYQLLVEDLQIIPAMTNVRFKKDVFMKTISQYNILNPQFDIVAFENGVVDFSIPRADPMLMPFSQEYHVLYYHPYPYNPNAKCNRWLNFLHEVLPDRTSRLILQMFLGLGLIQRGDAYNKYDGKMSSKIELCLLLVGNGSNGKSVIFDVACSLFGKDRISSMDYAELTADGDEGMRGRFPIRNAIFNWSSDSDPKKFGKKNTGMFKRIVSGEPVPMRQLGQNILESNAVPYLIFNLNELPFPEDASFGFIRRLQYISFDVTVPKERQDPDLSSKIVGGELSGVFNWVFRGMLEVRKRKYVFPVAGGSKKQLLKSLLGSQPIFAWMRTYDIRAERSVKGEQGIWIYCRELYDSFTQFCYDNNLDEERIPTLNKFGRTLWDKMSFVRKRTNEGVCYEVFGVNVGDLQEHLLIEDLPGHGDEDRTGSFIKDDD